MEDPMKSLLFVPFFFLFSAVVSAQDRGIIECQGLTRSVSALEGPGSLMVARQIPCGQTVTIVGIDRDYVRIQIEENVFGYVKRKNIRSMGSQGDTDRRIAELEAQVEALKHQSIVAQAQPIAKIERRPEIPEMSRSREEDSSTSFDVSGMFTWIRSFEDESDYFGWNAAFGGNITKHFGLEANASGNYWNSPVSFIDSSYHGFAGGPRFSFPAGRVTPFIHFLVGFTSTSLQ
jgi:hypothetical protein